MSKRRTPKVHIVAWGGKTACGLKLRADLILVGLSRSGVAQATCKNCQKRVKKITGKP